MNFSIRLETCRVRCAHRRALRVNRVLWQGLPWCAQRTLRVVVMLKGCSRFDRVHGLFRGNSLRLSHA